MKAFATLRLHDTENSQLPESGRETDLGEMNEMNAVAHGAVAEGKQTTSGACSLHANAAWAARTAANVRESNCSPQRMAL